MKLLRWLVGTVAALALLAVGGWWNQHPLARIPLPDGGELSLVEAHYGTTWHRELQLKEHVSLKTRIRNLFSSDIPDYSSHFGNDSPILWLVFEGFEPDVASAHQLVGDVMAMESGRVISVARATELEGDGLGKRRFLVPFETYPRRARQLQLRIGIRNWKIDATIPNPFPVVDAPVWMPESIPQTRKLKSGEILLLGLHRHPTEFQRGKTAYPGTSVEPEFVVRESGVRPDAFAFTHEFSDATGNRHYADLPSGESAWKIHTTVRRNEKYPFPASDGISVGHVSMPGPGEVRVIPLPENIAAGPEHYAVLTGPGKYRVSFRQDLESIAPKFESIQQADEHSAPSRAAIDETFTCEKPQFWFFGPSTMTLSSYQDGPTGIVRAVTRTGHVVFQQRVPQPGSPSSKAGNEDHERVETTLRAGDDLDIRFILAELESVDFLAQPPPK